MARIDVAPEGLFPYWQELKVAAEGMSELGGLEQDSGVRIRTDKSFRFPGPFHYIEDMQNHVLDRMPDWKVYKKGLGASSIWLHNS